MILSLDFETGGVDPNRHAPTAIGCAVMDGDNVVAECEHYIGPTLHWKSGKIEREYDVRALEVQGASWAKIKASPAPKVIVGHLAKFAAAHNAEQLPIVAYNAPFDIGFYSTLLWLASDWHPKERGVKVQPAPPFLGSWTCALMLARKELELPDYSLDTVAAHFGLSRSTEKHSALEDAVLCGRIYHALAGAASPPSIGAGTAPAKDGGLG